MCVQGFLGLMLLSKLIRGKQYRLLATRKGDLMCKYISFWGEGAHYINMGISGSRDRKIY